MQQIIGTKGHTVCEEIRFHLWMEPIYLNLGVDRNTRVVIFVTNLQQAQGETSASVLVDLLDSANQSYEVVAEDVRTVPNFAFTQITFRLPNNLSPGTCIIRVRARGQLSNASSIRIRI